MLLQRKVKRGQEDFKAWMQSTLKHFIVYGYRTTTATEWYLKDKQTDIVV